MYQLYAAATGADADYGVLPSLPVGCVIRARC